MHFAFKCILLYLTGNVPKLHHSCQYVKFFKINFAPVEQQALIRKRIQRIKMKGLTSETIVSNTLTGSGSGSGSVSVSVSIRWPDGPLGTLAT